MKSIEEETSDEDGVGPNGNDDASALRAAERSITKRDDKMRWVFGGERISSVLLLKGEPLADA